MPGLCERRGGVHSGGRYAQMCTFSRPLACEYQVLSGSRARMLKKKTGFDRFFLYRLSPEPRPSAPECERHGVGNCAGCVFAVRFSCVMVAGCAFYCVFQRQHLSTFCAAHGFITALQLIAKRLAFVSYVSIYHHTKEQPAAFAAKKPSIF